MSKFYRFTRLFSFLFSFSLMVTLFWPTGVHSLQPMVSSRPSLSKQDFITASRLSSSLTQNVRKTVLNNDLTVLTKEIHNFPVVSVQIWYRVGSQDELPEEKGIAHLLEHMMFRGTHDRPVEFSRLLAAIGGDFNAFVSADSTYYSDTTTSNNLRAILALEADRMQNPLLDEKGMVAEKKVLLSELQGQENSPYSRLYQSVMNAAFPGDPYGVTYTKAGLEQITIEQVRAFYRQYYRPENSVMVIVGDFQTEPILREIKALFGEIPKQQSGKNRQNRTIVSPSSSQSPLILRAPRGIPSIIKVYPLPAFNHPDAAALEVMDFLLTSGATSYVQRALMGSGLASEATGDATFLRTGGWYYFAASANVDQRLADINQLLDLIIDALKTQGVTEEEIDQAKAKVIGNSIFNSRDINSQASLLGYYQVIAGNYNFSNDYLEAIAKVTRADVQRVTQKYLSSANQTVGYLEPTEVDSKTSASISKGILQIPSDFPLQESVQAEELAQYLPPISPVDAGSPPKLPQRFTLANGLKVLMLQDSSVPAISLQGYLRAGGEFDSSDRIGLANLTAFNLVNGSNRRPIAPIQALENRGGVALDFQADTDGVRIFGVCLSNNLSFLLDNLADVLQNASLPADVLELLRQQYLSGLKVWADDPADVSAQAIVEAIYPTHHPLRQLPTPATIKAISQEDTVAFYRQYYRPDSTVLVFVGDFDPVQLRSQIGTLFGDWSAKGKPPVVDWPSVLLPSKKLRLNKVLPGMTEAVITIGTPIPDWTNWPDSSYLATLVLNEILGNSALSSRLGNEVRYRQGLAYALQSSLQEGLHTGLFLIGIKTAPENTERAIASTFAVFKQLREQGVTEFEVEIAKRSLISNYQLTQSNPDSLASQILTHQLFSDNPDEIRQWPRKIQEISLTQVNQMAQLLLDPERMVVVTVEPD